MIFVAKFFSGVIPKQIYYKNKKHYEKVREKLIETTENAKFKGVDFTQFDLQANKIFLDILRQEREQLKDEYFQGNILKNQDQFVQNRLYEILRLMPKGVLHHMHFDTALDGKWFVEELAFLPTTFYNEAKNKFKYFKDITVAEEGYVQLCEELAKHQNKEQFRRQIEEKIYLTREDLSNTSDKRWEIFESKIQSFWELVLQKDYFLKYLKNCCENLYQDGIYRIEARAFLGAVFDENHKHLSLEEHYSLFQEAQQYIRDKYKCPVFSYGIIIQGLRMWNDKQILENIRRSVEAASLYPDFYLGYDLVQDESIYPKISKIKEILLQKINFEIQYQHEIPFVFHAAETVTEYRSNENAYDVILMNSRRIGHGLGFIHYSHLLPLIRENQICLEISPISNQLLTNVYDLRTHPFRSFLNQNIPVTISCDDPGFFGYNRICVTHDFYALTISQELDLKELKLICLNSIKHALCNPAQKSELYNHFNKNWNQFVVNFITKYSN